MRRWRIGEANHYIWLCLTTVDMPYSLGFGISLLRALSFELWVANPFSKLQALSSKPELQSFVKNISTLVKQSLILCGRPMVLCTIRTAFVAMACGHTRLLISRTITNASNWTNRIGFNHILFLNISFIFRPSYSIPTAFTISTILVEANICLPMRNQANFIITIICFWASYC